MLKIQNYGKESSIHGIKFVLSQNQHYFTRIFWTLAIFFSICGFFYYIHSAYSKFMLDPEIVIKSTDRNSSDFPAPAITICSNLFAKDNLGNLVEIIKNLQNVPNLTASSCIYTAANLHWCQPTFSPLISEVCPEQNLDNINVLQLINESALSIREAFIKCDKCAYDKDITRVFTDEGICFTRNSLSFSSIFKTEVIHDDFKCFLQPNIINVSWTPEQGYKSANDQYPERARRELNFELMPFLTKTEKENLCSLRNFKIYLHKPNEIATPRHEMTFLSFNEFMDIRVTIKSHKTDEGLRKFAPDQRKCYFEGERDLKFFKTYSTLLCEWECKANATLESCGCIKFSMPRDSLTPICNLTSLFNCVIKIPTHQCNCLPSCIDIKYSYKIERTDFMRNIYEKFIPNDYVLSNFKVKMESEVVEEIENFMSYKLQNFISDFGSLLGLFMGCSLLSIIEVLFFITKSFFEVTLLLKPRSGKICTEKTQELQTECVVNSRDKTEHSESREIFIKFKKIDERFTKTEKTLEEIMLIVQNMSVLLKANSSAAQNDNKNLTNSSLDELLDYF